MQHLTTTCSIQLTLHRMDAKLAPRLAKQHIPPLINPFCTKPLVPTPDTKVGGGGGGGAAGLLLSQQPLLL